MLRGFIDELKQDEMKLEPYLTSSELFGCAALSLSASVEFSPSIAQSKNVAGVGHVVSGDRPPLQLVSSPL